MILIDAIYDLHFKVIHSILKYSGFDFPSLFYDTFPQTLRRIIDNVIHYSSIPSYGSRFKLILLFQNSQKSSQYCFLIFYVAKATLESVAGRPYSSFPHKVKFELCRISCCYNSTKNYLLSLLGQTSLCCDI